MPDLLPVLPLSEEAFDDAKGCRLYRWPPVGVTIPITRRRGWKLSFIEDQDSEDLFRLTGTHVKIKRVLQMV